MSIPQCGEAEPNIGIVIRSTEAKRDQVVEFKVEMLTARQIIAIQNLVPASVAHSTPVLLGVATCVVQFLSPYRSAGPAQASETRRGLLGEPHISNDLIVVCWCLLVSYSARQVTNPYLGLLCYFDQRIRLLQQRCKYSGEYGCWRLIRVTQFIQSGLIYACRVDYKRAFYRIERG